MTFKIGDEVRVNCKIYIGEKAKYGKGIIIGLSSGHRGKWDIKLEDSMVLSYNENEMTLINPKLKKITA